MILYAEPETCRRLGLSSTRRATHLVVLVIRLITDDHVVSVVYRASCHFESVSDRLGYKLRPVRTSEQQPRQEYREVRVAHVLLSAGARWETWEPVDRSRSSRSTKSHSRGIQYTGSTIEDTKGVCATKGTDDWTLVILATKSMPQYP